MKNGKIEKIVVDAFHSLTELQFIDLSYNELHYVRHDLFIQNQKLKFLSLSNNQLTMLPNDGPILTSSSLLHLYMENCMISELSSTSLSQLPNLQSLDLSRNELKVLSEDTLRPLVHLININLNGNQWTCNDDFEKLVCLAYHISKSQPHNMKCFMKNGERKDYNMQVQYELCGELPDAKPSVTSITPTPTVLQETNESDKAFTPSTSTDPPRPNDKKGPEISEEDTSGKQTTPYGKRDTGTQVTSEDENTTPKSETGGWWDDSTLTVLVILPITLGGAVFVSLIAVKCVTRRFNVHHPQQHTQEAYFDIRSPLLNTQLTADFTRQGQVFVNRSSDVVHSTEYHVYEEIR